MAFPGIAHVAVTVTDLDRSVPWYEALLDAKPVMDEDTGPYRHVVWLLEGGTLMSLHQHSKSIPGEPATEFHTGLDHIGFGVENRGELEKWEKRLDELGVKHGGIVDAHYGSALSFRDPDNIPLEIFAAPA